MNAIQVQELTLPDVKLLRPKLHHDDRGYLTEVVNARAMEELGLPGTFVQENLSLSLKAGTVRALHFQKPPYAQGKLVRVLRGKIFDVAVDMRPHSLTFGRFASVTMSEDAMEQMWIPAGFAHGFCTLADNTVVQYKVTAYYAPGSDAGMLWNDPALGIPWPVDPGHAILSDKDKKLPLFKDLPPIAW